MEHHQEYLAFITKKWSYGGTIQFGWVIWQDILEAFTEAEFHSVWVNGAGKFHDVTPRIDHEKRIMFLPDKVRKPEISYFGHFVKIKSYTNYKVLKGETFKLTGIFEHFLEADKVARIGVTFKKTELLPTLTILL